MNSLFRVSAAVLDTAFALFAPSAVAGSIRYEFTAGSLAPTLTDVPAGVTASNFVIGSGFGSMFDNGGSPDSLRLSGNDNAKTGTAAAFTANSYFSFSITIPAGTTVSLASLGLDYQAMNAVANANSRIFSSLKGYANATGDTVGVLGRRSGGTDSVFVSDLISLSKPRTPSPGNYMVGGNIADGDFTNLSGGTAGRTITFYMPFIPNATAATAWVDLDNIVLTLEPNPAPIIPVNLAVTDFRMMGDRSSRITFSGTQGQPYSLMASNGLDGPVYRKNWTLMASGVFGVDPVVYPDADAVNAPRRFYVVSAGGLPKARIMPVGDSITEGASNMVVYKGPLYDKLTAAGYRFTYVGSRSSSYTTPGGTVVSLNHEGYSGNNVTQVANLLASNFPLYPADIVIIHSAHNLNVAEAVLDAAGEAAIVSTVETATRSMIATCRNTNPKVKIILAQVIPAGKLPKYSYIPAVNVRLGQIGAELNTAAQPVIMVNQETDFNPGTDLTKETDTISDKVHPDASGGEKMAAKFFTALAPLLE